jgi:hypothetical protein
MNFIMAAIENDRDALIQGVAWLFNCREVDVEDETGRIWIANPQRGHWLDDEGLAKVERALKAGDI